MIKNLEFKTLALIFPALLIVESAQWVHSILHGWLHLKFKSYWELAALLPRILKKREAIQARRQVSDREIVRLYKGQLAVAGLNHPLMKYFLSPLLNAYWMLIHRLI
jgi:hypothetical protein